jgi:thiamine kinase-like enzyme
VHGDIRPDNMLVSDGGLVLVDWAFAAAGAPWLDLADLIPQMILAGHAPAAAEEHLERQAAWRNAPAEAITCYAAACADYWIRSSRLPAPADTPHLRAYQACAGRAAADWAEWRWATERRDAGTLGER